jgi:hypothetical protein
MSRVLDEQVENLRKLVAAFHPVVSAFSVPVSRLVDKTASQYLGYLSFSSKLTTELAASLPMDIETYYPANSGRDPFKFMMQVPAYQQARSRLLYNRSGMKVYLKCGLPAAVCEKTTQEAAILRETFEALEARLKRVGKTKHYFDGCSRCTQRQGDQSREVHSETEGEKPTMKVAESFSIDGTDFELRLVTLPYPPGPGEDYRYRVGLFKYCDASSWHELEDLPLVLSILGSVLAGKHVRTT